ncbi:hypothetical protein LZM42_13000, partial [Pseudomonas aeruginosa]|nr:hypothetical protein [Pseudomonas aeruginosa]
EQGRGRPPALPAELAPASASEALAWGVAHWDATRIPRCATLPEERL